jgi:hypothetical protein
MRLCWRTRKTSQIFRQKRPTWPMRSVLVRFRWDCIGRRLMRCSHLNKESLFMTSEDDGCVGGIGAVAAKRGARGNSSVGGKDKTSRHGKHRQLHRMAKRQRLPPARIRFALQLLWRAVNIAPRGHPCDHGYHPLYGRGGCLFRRGIAHPSRLRPAGAFGGYQ